MQEITLSKDSINQIAQMLDSSLEERLNKLIPKPIEKYLTRKEAANILGITPDTLSNNALSGLVDYKRTGKQYLFSLRDIESFNIKHKNSKLN